MKKNEILCLNPSCLKIFPEDEALFVCEECYQDTKCETSDIHLEHSNDYYVFELPTQRPWFFRVLNIKSIVPCPKCKKVTYQRACPRCHSQLIGETEKGFEKSNFITMVGGPSSGKTAYLISLMYHASILSPQTKVLCEPYTLITNTWYAEMINFFKKNGKFLPTKDLESLPAPKLHTLLQSCGGKFSLVYRVTPPHNQENSYIVSVDPEGEIWTHTGSEQVKRCRLLLSRAEAIFFFINPLSIAKVRKKIGQVALDRLQEDLNKIEEISPDLLLAKVSQILSEIGYPKKQNFPFAVLVTHTDLLFDLLNEIGINIFDYAGKKYNKFYPKKLNERISEFCKEFLEKFGMGNFIEMVERKFKTHSFFFTAANIEDPRISQESGPPYEIIPFRVIDPLLWVLWNLKQIEAEKDNEN